MSKYNKKSYKKQFKKMLERGFSLIELMIAVAIIAVIVALAVPAYQDHVARAQITEAWNMIEIVRIRMWEYYAQHGTFPVGAETGRVVTSTVGNTLYDLPAPTALGGRYVESVTVNSSGMLWVMSGSGMTPILDAANGVLVKMRPNAASPIAGKVIGFQMYIESNDTIRWVCSTKVSPGGSMSMEVPANFGQVDLRLLPGSCRTLD